MRSRPMLRAPRALPLAGGALILAIPATAVALNAGSADAQSAIHARLSAHRAPLGRAVVVSGGPFSAPGHTRLALQFAPAGSRAWHILGRTTASPTGTYRFTLPAARSGLLRVVPFTGADASAAAASGGSAPSAPQSLTVGSRFVVPARTLTVAGGGRAAVHGALRPAVRGRRVVLETRSGRRWRALTATRTNPQGGFRLLTRAPGGSRHALRVRFAGDRLNAGSTAGAGSIASAFADVASWYDDSGATACGYHATYGVANRSLPCGTKVTISRGGRSVTATVDDRGPYVGGRNWDLNQNVAGALGFDGVGTIWVSY